MAATSGWDRWSAIQTRFVDEPRQSIEDADAFFDRLLAA